MRRRGTSLIMVLGLATAAILVAFATANVAVFNLHFSSGLDRREHARNLAESVINLAIARLSEHDDYGVSHDASDDLLFEGVDYPGRSRGFLTFNAASAGGHHMHWSTNNVNFGPAPGDGRPFVPSYTAHLVGLGECGEVRVQVECLYHRPPFPKGLSATGKGRLNNVTLLGLAPGASFNGDWSLVPEGDRVPANVFTCSTAADGLHLDAHCLVTGGAGSCGGVVLDSGARVGGEVRARAAPQEVPHFNAHDMLDRLSHTMGLLPFTPGQVLGDLALCPGDLTLDQDLVLEGGVLGVTGNLKMINGAQVRGRGALIVGGSADLVGSALESGRQCALVADGPVTLVSSDSNNFFFQGIVYSSSNIVASGVTVVGAMICHGPPGGGDVQLDNARIIESSVEVQGRRGIPWSVNAGTTQPHVSPGGEPDGADGMLFSFYSLADPLQPGKFLMYGRARYSMSPRDPATGMLNGPNSGVDVLWVPGHSIWSVHSGVTDFDVRIPMGDKPYDGKPASLISDLRLLSVCDKTNPPTDVTGDPVYYNEIQNQLEGYISSLQGVGHGGEYFDFNLNRIMAPGEDARILLMREVE